MSTKADLRTLIKREARIKTGTDLDILIDSIMLEILYDYCNLTRFNELLVPGAVITLVDGQAAYDLPEDCQNVAELHFSQTSTSSTFLSLPVEPASIRHTYAGGFPRFYRRITGRQISLWPYTSILSTNVLLIDYYLDPRTIFVDDDDDFPIPRLEAAVKKDTIARIQRFHSSLPEAKMMDADGAASFNASQGSS